MGSGHSDEDGKVFVLVCTLPYDTSCELWRSLRKMRGPGREPQPYSILFLDLASGSQLWLGKVGTMADHMINLMICILHFRLLDFHIKSESTSI